MYLMTRWFPAPSLHPPCSLAQLRTVHGTREGHRRHGRAGWNVLPGASHPHHSRATQPRVQAPVEWYVQHNSCGRVRVCADVVGAVASTKPDDDGGKKGYKAKKEDERKATAMKDANVWHSLFIRSDTAVQALAEKFGLKQVCYRHPLHLPPRRTSPTLYCSARFALQGDIMDKNASNLAVRAALAETHVIKETKDFLESVRSSMWHGELFASAVSPLLRVCSWPHFAGGRELGCFGASGATPCVG